MWNHESAWYFLELFPFKTFVCFICTGFDVLCHNILSLSIEAIHYVHNQKPFDFNFLKCFYRNKQKKNYFCQATCPDLRCGAVVLGDEGSHCPAVGGPLSLTDPRGDRIIPQRAQRHLL